jgi:tetratricopeptide (TPR) repeat protein
MILRIRLLKIFLSVALIELLPGVLAQTGVDRASAITSALRDMQFDKALQLLRPALDQSPQDARLWALEGIAFSGKGQKKEALASFQTSLKFSPNYLPALEGAAQLEYESGSEAAGPLLERILRVQPKDPTSHAMLGVIAYKHHDCEQSVEHFEQARSVLDSQPSALQEYGACLVKLRQLDRAIAAFQRALTSHPEDHDVRYQLAVVQLMAELPGDACKTLAPLLEDAHPDERTLELAASAYEANGDTPQAVSTLRQAIVMNPRNVDLYVDFANIAMQHQSFQAGIDMINSGLALQPNAAPLYVARGVLYAQLAEFDKAEADFDRADALDPHQSIGAAALGLAAIQKNDLDHALTTVRSKLAKKPADPYLLYLESDILSQKGLDPDSPDFQAAIRSAHQAVSLQPSLVPARDLLAKLYLQAGENAQAVQQARTALQYDPKDQTALYHLIQALRKSGERAELPDLLKRLGQLRQEAAREERERNRYKLVVGDASESKSTHEQ